MPTTRLIFLIGFSGTGKSQVGREVARRLGWAFVDLDTEIAALAQKSIPQIFAEEGEGRFRELEREVLKQVSQKEHTVVATGGGVVLDPRNRELMLERGVVIALEASPETIYHRLQQQGDSALRPLLSGPHPLERIGSLKAHRQPFYSLAHWIVQTDLLTPSEVAAEVVRGWQTVSRRQLQAEGGQVESLPLEAEALWVTTPVTSYPVLVGWGLLGQLGQAIKAVGLSGPLYLIGDRAAFIKHGRRLQEILERAGLATHIFTIPPGEPHKTLEMAVLIYHWLTQLHAEREHPVLALGGGMVGDLAGFVAATFLRGMPLIHVPTTLVAMVDAAIGGKTAVNLPEAKNLVGAFYHPRLVLADVETLTTLPQRERVSGWAETIKHGLIQDAELLALMEEQAQELLELQPEVTTQVVRRSAAVKARIVAQDERETLGPRTLLNYGHTIGHALEAATGYRRFLHGEAVAVGMMGDALISEGMGLISHHVVERQKRLLKRFGLPTTCPGIDPRALLEAMELDKKRAQGKIRWVVLEAVGRATIRQDVPRELLLEVLQQLAETAPP